MSLGKKNISKNIASKTHLSNETSLKLINSFLQLIASNINKCDIKIKNFGVFNIRTTPKRIGRNPRTKEEFVIPERKKATFKASIKVKYILN
jgi:integration host factor subunit alpha